MNDKYINIYINLVNLTRNKDLYKNFSSQDTFSDRLVFFLLHFAFFLKVFKNNDKRILQDIYDFIFKQLELSIREIGYGDVSINKKMKDYINFFHSIINKIENWSSINHSEKNKRINYLLNSNNNSHLSVYFDKYSIELKNNTLNYYIKSVIKPKK
jgi:cytochrome b pre-mRNA-processing protein 3